MTKSDGKQGLLCALIVPIPGQIYSSVIGNKKSTIIPASSSSHLRDCSSPISVYLSLFLSLVYQDLEAQMVLLGRVKDVGEFQLLVSLPCHLVGAVPVTSISSTYSKLISSQLEDEVSSLRSA